MLKSKKSKPESEVSNSLNTNNNTSASSQNSNQQQNQKNKRQSGINNTTTTKVVTATTPISKQVRVVNTLNIIGTLILREKRISNAFFILINLNIK